MMCHLDDAVRSIRRSKGQHDVGHSFYLNPGRIQQRMKTVYAGFFGQGVGLENLSQGRNNQALGRWQFTCPTRSQRRRSALPLVSTRAPALCVASHRQENVALSDSSFLVVKALNRAKLFATSWTAGREIFLPYSSTVLFLLIIG